MGSVAFVFNRRISFFLSYLGPILEIGGGGSARLYNMQNYAMCTIMQGSKSCKIKTYERCNIMQNAISQQSKQSAAESAFVQIAHPPAFGACFFRGGYWYISILSLEKFFWVTLSLFPSMPIFLPMDLQCTMVKLKNGVKSSQLWQIISPSIFNENLPKFERWRINIQKIKINNLFAKYYEKKYF